MGAGPELPSVVVLCVGADPAFRRTVRRAFADLLRDVGALVDYGDHGGDGRSDWDPPPRYTAVMTRARSFLRNRAAGITVHLVCTDSLADVPAHTNGVAAETPGLLLLDSSAGGLGLDAMTVDRDLENALQRWPHELRPPMSPAGVYVYLEPDKPQVQPSTRVTLRQRPAEDWLLAADAVCAVTDVAEVLHVRPALAADDTVVRPRTLANALHSFLTDRAGSRWGLGTYTGSVVSGLISDLERLCGRGGQLVLRGPSEHSLACGALARWMLDEAPFLLVVTSGMVDEFRGTLANLRQAQARGFIILAESGAERWYPFQGTIHGDEDSRDVLRARRLRTVHMAHVADLRRGLTEAYAAYDADDGPVVLLVAPSVLDCREPGPELPARPALDIDRRETGVQVAEDPMDAVMRIVNDEPVRLLWQVGHPATATGQLLHTAAHRVGAALCDSMIRPGSVANYQDRVRLPQYLGTLGLYGFSSRVYDFLHDDGRLRPKGSQCVFFLGSRIAESATPFSARTLWHGLRIVQVTHQAAHLAPFADHRVEADVGAFLRRLLDRADVAADVLDLRRRAIDDAQPVSDPLELLPLRPMTANYFFHELNAVVEDLVEADGYDYVGVYDVGRGGAAAIRNVARTRLGFSGWYGRALMGDALQAVPAIALSRPHNVLAFIGDGAAALVPDVLPSLLQQICVDGHRLRGNVSIFRLLNGGHSIIRTYRETRDRQPDRGQTTVFNLIDDDWSRTVGPVRITHRRLEDVDRRRLREDLLKTGMVNVFSVMLGHNNEGDGLSLLSARSWHQTGRS